MFLDSRGDRRLTHAGPRTESGFFNSPRVHFMRNALAHAGKSGRRVVAAFIATAFAQEDADAARTQWRLVADQLRPKVPKLATLMDKAEPDVLAFALRGLRGSARKFTPSALCSGSFSSRCVG